MRLMAELALINPDIAGFLSSKYRSRQHKLSEQ